MESRADLQLHSCHSNKPDGWILRRMGVPESYTRPADLHRMALQAGMNFFTITDRNSIDGCLEVAHLPGVFISEQVTTAFEDGCKLHVLVWDITEEQHREIQEVRHNVHHLVAYLRHKGIAHAVSHPLVAVNDRLTPENVGKMLLLFDCLEGLNGTRDETSSRLLRLIVENLTPELTAELENRYGFRSPLERPWVKTLTGGSDDHSGLIVGRAHTVTPAAATAAEFIAHVRAGRCRPEGRAGDPMTLAHSLYTTAYQFYEDKIARGSKGAASTSRLVGLMFSKFLAGRNPTRFTFGEKVGIGMGWLGSRLSGSSSSAYELSVASELNEIFGRPSFQKKLEEAIAREQETERRAFQVATHLTHEIGYVFFKKFLDRVNAGSFLDSWQALTAIAPLGALLAPYVVSLRDQHKNLPLQREVASRLLKSPPAEFRNLRRGWFTDTIEDVNGVAHTIRTVVKEAVKAGCDLEVVTSRGQLAFNDIPLKNFPPVGEFEIPEYELQKLSFPPTLNIVDYCERRKFTELVISTPGPVGLSALLAAKLLGLRTSGIYHTDFPQYVKILSDDHIMETLCWQYMWWFYDQMDLIWVNSEHYRQLWIKRGIRADKIRILPRGIDTASYNTRHRDRGFWERHGVAPDETLFLYVGRVSKEKDIDVLLNAYNRLPPGKHRLAVVGDGPYLPELKGRNPGVVFTGYLRGEALHTAYASADVFCFPSTTDTFGNVVLEAHASGLPTLVSDVGGPCELVAEGRTGHITPAFDSDALARVMASLVTDPARIRAMGAEARASVEERSWSHAFHQFWNATL